MGADGRFELIKIGRGQHLLPDDAIRFTVVEPVAVIYLYPAEFGEHWNLTSLNNAIDGTIESGRGPLPCAPIYGSSDGSQRALSGGMTVQVVAELKLISEMAGGDKVWDEFVRDSDPARIDAWAKITPGLWCLAGYTTHGAGGHYSLTLPHDHRGEIEILETVEFECWT